MIKKSITHVDPFTKKEETVDYYFNLTKFEAIEVNMIDDLAEIGKANDRRRAVGALKRIIKHSVGERIGDRFVKNEEFADAFIASDAYSILLIEILANEDPEKLMAEFIAGVVPWTLDNPDQKILPELDKTN